MGPAPNIHLAPNPVVTSSPILRDSARVVVMDNFGIFPSVEEEIDFVDQSGYVFNSNITATLNHVPVVLHWWREESRFIDGDSAHDVVTYICNKLIPTFIKNRNAELTERLREREQQEENKANKNKGKSEENSNKNDEKKTVLPWPSRPEDDDTITPEQNNHDEGKSAVLCIVPHRLGFHVVDEDIDGVPIEDMPVPDRISNLQQAENERIDFEESSARGKYNSHISNNMRAIKKSQLFCVTSQNTCSRIR